MKLKLSLKNARAAVSGLKKGRPSKVSIEAEPGLLTTADGLLLLRDAADLCIERGIALEIADIPPCLLPGYARYLRAGAGEKLSCPRAERCFLKKTCSGISARYAGVAGVFKPPERAFTDLENCMLKILSAKNGLTTSQVLRAAKGIKICASCSNEGAVFQAAERLIKFGLVSKKYVGGVYIWEKI